MLRRPQASDAIRDRRPHQTMVGRPSLRDEPLSTEAVDNSVDCLASEGRKTQPYCIFMTLVKK
jgi:hypothetical protein